MKVWFQGDYLPAVPRLDRAEQRTTIADYLFLPSAAEDPSYYDLDEYCKLCKGTCTTCRRYEPEGPCKLCLAFGPGVANGACTTGAYSAKGKKCSLHTPGPESTSEIPGNPEDIIANVNMREIERWAAESKTKSLASRWLRSPTGHHQQRQLQEASGRGLKGHMRSSSILGGPTSDLQLKMISIMIPQLAGAVFISPIALHERALTTVSTPTPQKLRERPAFALPAFSRRIQKTSTPLAPNASYPYLSLRASRQYRSGRPVLSRLLPSRPVGPQQHPRLLLRLLKVNTSSHSLIPPIPTPH